MVTKTLDKIGKIVSNCTFKRGVHPPHRKLTESDAVERAELQPQQIVVIPMVQHIGAPNSSTVKVKDEVTVGQVLGETEAFVSAPVHSPVNGVVKQVAAYNHPSGQKIAGVVITVGENQPKPRQWNKLPDGYDLDKIEADSIGATVRKAGIVGMGGAAFPTAVKLANNPQKPVDTIILNGCECEPYLTSDHRLMLEAPGPIVAGLQLAMKAAGASRGFIAIENNKPDAIETLTNAITGIDNLQLAVCQTKYPQGGEKQLIQAVLNRDVPTGGLPLDVKVVVINVGTASSIAFACATGEALTERIVTVTGKGVNKPGNYMVPVGMLLSDLLDHCGGLNDKAEKVLLGGPMMGPTTATLDIPILKGTSGITVMTGEEFQLLESTACIRCSRCVDYCPMNLTATRIAHAIKARDVEMALEYDLSACIECGCCSYVCPAQIPLVQYMRSGKLLARKIKK